MTAAAFGTMEGVLMTGNVAIDINRCWEALRKVIDPELQFDIVDLGLVYKLEAEGATVNMEMTLTSPGCPLAPQMVMSAENELLKVEGVEKANVKLVWSPPWTPEKMSEEAKIGLGW